jgi:hypothetical protein
MSPRDGSVRSVAKIVDHGSGSARWDLVIMGDGYRSDELAKYESDVEVLVAGILTTPPFDRLRGAVNVHRVNVESRESGAGDLCAGTRRSTFFDSNFCGHQIDRLLIADAATGLETAVDAVPTMNASLIVVNSETYGGSGGAVPVCSLASGAYNIALHEMGHSQFGLADEYADSLRPGQDIFQGDEPGEPNVTSRIAPLKWSHLVAEGVPLPTTGNPDCAEVDVQASPFPPETVGAFEGAFYHHCRIYRPQHDCKMRNVAADFCRVCAETIERVLQPFLPKSTRRRSVRSR